MTLGTPCFAVFVLQLGNPLTKDKVNYEKLLQYGCLKGLRVVVNRGMTRLTQFRFSYDN